MAAITNEQITEKLQSKFGESILKSEEPYGLLTITVPREKVIEVLRFLKEDSTINQHFLTDLTGVHYPDPSDELGVVYHLHNMPENVRVRVKTFFPKTDPQVDTATVLWNSANWMERETYDFFGVIFKGHPNLKRILNVDDLGYFPMRKEYALEDPTRDDKDDRFFGRGIQ